MARPRDGQRAGRGVLGAKLRRSGNDKPSSSERKQMHKGHAVMKFMSVWINPGRKVIFRGISPLLRREGVRLPADLKGFLAMEEPWYPELVAEFYRNLSCSVDKPRPAAAAVTLSSSVGGVKFSMDERTMAAITGLYPCGLHLHRKNCKALGWDEDGIIRRLCGSEAAAYGAGGSPKRLQRMSTRYLTSAARVLANIVVHNLLPRGHWHHDLTPAHALCMYALMEGMDVNWPRLFLNRMADAVSLQRALPYGMMLTRVFRHFGVALIGGVEGMKTAMLDEKSLGQKIDSDKSAGSGSAPMEEKKETRRKPRKGKEQRRREKMEEEEVPIDRVTEPAAGEELSSTSHIHDLYRFLAETCDNYNEIRFKVLDLRDTMAALEDQTELRISTLEKQHGKLFDFLKRNFPPPLPRKS